MKLYSSFITVLYEIFSFCKIELTYKILLYAIIKILVFNFKKNFNTKKLVFFIISV